MLHLNLNGEPCEAPEGTRLQQFAHEAKPEADVVIRNGFQTSEDAELADGDSITLIRKGEFPPQETAWG